MHFIAQPNPDSLFCLQAQTHLIWKTTNPAPIDRSVSMNLTMMFADVSELWMCCSCRAD